ncbi:flagellar filament capping protein FliD [Clostridium bowmanii]|uniref:flagellar filament capping protein FliD n=1 Tax=Clostridium bowmanii TaxID=132925 RepID=UPI001C0E5C10|nr:flagellar filament capping protein FliD [Clostridium bowmanii]MBU3190706.1 flagellar filament capping protein FliD [Clostridium bowmanii]MCA1075048.1 flagellar filament capping protein FliD [Clostridium bowmanii]
MTSIYPTGATSGTKSSANMLRISGMASGIDTDALVKSMVSNYQSKIDKANAAKQTVQWQQEGYREIIKGVKGLQDYFDPLSSKYMMSGNSFNINTATSDGTSVVMATSASTAKAGTYKVNVTQLAQQAEIEGDNNNSMIKVTDLSNWSGKTLNFDGWASISLSALTDTTPTNANMSKLAEDINKKIALSVTTTSPEKTSLKGKISASYVNDETGSYIKFTKLDATTSITLESTAHGSSVLGITDDLVINSGISSSSKLVSDFKFTTGTAGNLKFTLKSGTTDYPVSLTVNDTTTIQNLMDAVNSATGGQITMNIDDTTGKISFKSKGDGSNSNISITNGSTGDSVIAKLGISSTETTIIDIGEDAIVAITAPGQTATTTTQSSNKFTVNGVNYNLVGVSKTGESSNVTVTANSDTVVTNVKKFIEDYNTIVSTINTKLTEKKDKDFAPLTDDQRTSMSEDQIKTWEAKAKVGLLRKDDYLSSLLTQLRGVLYAPVYSAYDSADTSAGKVSLSFGSYGSGAIGLGTSEDLSDGGKLVIKDGDEAKFKNAIENHMDDFKKLFIGSSSSTLDSNTAYIGSKKYNEDGIFKRMDNIIRDYVASPGVGKDGKYTTAGYMNIFVNKQYDNSSLGTSGKNTLPDQVYSKVLSVSRFQTQLQAAQTRYYAKFTALETAMNALNSQQSSLASMLGTSS